MTIDNLTARDCKAQGGSGAGGARGAGAAIFANQGVNLTVSNVMFTGHNATGGTGGFGLESALGGAGMASGVVSGYGGAGLLAVAVE